MASEYLAAGFSHHYGGATEFRACIDCSTNWLPDDDLHFLRLARHPKGATHHWHDAKHEYNNKYLWGWKEPISQYPKAASISITTNGIGLLKDGREIPERRVASSEQGREPISRLRLRLQVACGWTLCTTTLKHFQAYIGCETSQG